MTGARRIFTAEHAESAENVIARKSRVGKRFCRGAWPCALRFHGNDGILLPPLFSGTSIAHCLLCCEGRKVLIDQATAVSYA